MSKMWYVYILRTALGTLYTGITLDVKRRMREHASGRGAKYLRGKQPLKLVHVEAHRDKATALKREAAIKRMAKAEKEALIRKTQ